jgi:hypothetical protein
MLDCIGCLPVTPIREVAALLGLPRRQVAALLDEKTLFRLNRVAVVGCCLIEQAQSDRRLAHLLRVRAALIRYDDCAASHESSAIARGLPVFAIPPHVCLTREAGAWRGGPQLRVRIAPLDRVELVDGIRCTPLDRTIVDIARSRSLRESAVPGDAALRQGLSRAELVRALDDAASWADVGRAAKSVAFFDGRSESALESVSRVVIVHEAKLAEPELQFVIDLDQDTSYRLDFYWKLKRVIGEADGLSKYETVEVIRAEKIRQERLENSDRRVVRWTWPNMVGETPVTVARIRSAIS